MKKILTACLMAALCQSVFADGRWLHIGTQKSGEFKLYIDTYRSTPENVWVKYVFSKKQPMQYTEQLEQLEVNCQNKRIALKQRISYDKAGNVISSRKFDQYTGEGVPNEVVPGSIGESTINYICTPKLSPRERAALELDVWSSEMRRREPQEYAYIEPILLANMSKLVSNFPPPRAMADRHTG